MPDDSVLIGILKWVALALALGSTLWGLLAPKPNREEADGRKRLTTSGIVTLAIILSGVAVSGLSLWVETAIGQRNDAEAARSKAETERAGAVRDRIQKVTEAQTRVAAANSGKSLAEIGAARAEGRAEAANSRVEALARETRERLRDIELAQRVATGTRDNLARTGEALTQIERVLQPLEALTVSVIWEFPAGDPRMRAATARMADATRRAEEQRRRDWDATAHRGGMQFTPATTISIPRDDPLYPRWQDSAERVLFANLSQPRADLAIFAEGAASDTALARLKGAQDDVEKVGDLRLRIGPVQRPTLTYVLASGVVRFELSATVEPEKMGRTGAIVSLPDLERGFAIIGLSYGGSLLASARAVAVTIQSPSRLYELPVEGMRRIPTRQPRAVFALPPLRRTMTP